MNQEYIYQIVVKNYPDNKTEVSQCLDPLFDAKLLLEGVGVLVPEILKWSNTRPISLKEELWNMTREQVIQILKDYLEIAGKDYNPQ